MEGGAITTENDQLAKQIRLMRNFGFQGADNVISLGINGKMNDISAAMGLTLLEEMDSILDHNRRNYQVYKDSLKGISGVSLLPYNEKENNNFQYVVIKVGPEIGLGAGVIAFGKIRGVIRQSCQMGDRQGGVPL